MKKLRIISLVLVVLMTMCLFSCGKNKTEDFYPEYNGDFDEMFISIESSDGRLEKIVTDKEDIERVVYYLNNTKFKADDVYNIRSYSMEKTSVTVIFFRDGAAKCWMYYYPSGSVDFGCRRGLSADKNFEEGLFELYKSIDAPEGKNLIKYFVLT